MASVETGTKVEPGKKEQPDRRQSKLTWLLPLTLGAGLVLLYFVWPAFHTFVSEAYEVVSSGKQQRIEAWVSQFGAWGFVVILALMLVQSLLAFIPSVLIMVVTVLAYGPYVGGVLTYGGLLIAASMAYGIGRLLGPVTVEKLIGSQTRRKVHRFIRRYGLWAIIAARISPLLSTDAVSYGAGLLGMGYGRFIAATAAGTLPLTVLIAYLGADIDRLKSGLIWVSVVTLLLFVGYVVYDRRKRRRGEKG